MDISPESLLLPSDPQLFLSTPDHLPRRATRPLAPVPAVPFTNPRLIRQRNPGENRDCPQHQSA